MPTLAKLRADTIAEADVEGIIDNSTVDDLLNEELGELYDLLVTSFEDYAVTTAVINVPIGTDIGDTPVDFYKAIDFTNSPATRSFERFEFMDRFRATGYCVHGDRILVRPAATAPGNYILTYVPAYTDLVGDDDEFDAPGQWTLYAVVSAAARIKDTQGLDASALRARKKDLRDRIEVASRQRNIGTARQPRDLK